MDLLSFRLSVAAFVVIFSVWVTPTAMTIVVEKHFPFHAFIYGPALNCTGILISEDYVLAPGRCVNGSKAPVTVYLGVHGDPRTKADLDHSDVQLAHSDLIIVHEEFTVVFNTYLNDIALIKLLGKVRLTDVVQPAKFMSKQELLLLDERLVTISGWLFKASRWRSDMIRLQNSDTCNYVFDNKFLRSTKLCARAHEITTYFHGDPITLDGKVLGFISRGPCTILSKICYNYEQIQVIPPYLDWILRHSYVNITGIMNAGKGGRDASSEKQEEDLEKLSRIVEKHNKLIEELKTGQNHLVLETIKHTENKAHDDIRFQIGELSEKTKNLETTIREMKAGQGEIKRFEMFQKLWQENHDLLKHVKDRIEDFSKFSNCDVAAN